MLLALGNPFHPIKSFVPTANVPTLKPLYIFYSDWVDAQKI